MNVKAPYPSVNRPLVKKVLQFTVAKFSEFQPVVVTNLVELTMF